MNLERKRKTGAEREREGERATPTMYLKLREGGGRFAATVAPNTQISITDRNKHTNQPFAV